LGCAVAGHRHEVTFSKHSHCFIVGIKGYSVWLDRFCFDAFSLREPVPIPLENAM